MQLMETWRSKLLEWCKKKIDKYYKMKNWQDVKQAEGYVDNISDYFNDLLESDSSDREWGKD